MSERFYKLPQSLAGSPDIPPAAKIVFAAVADMIGNNGYCWPGVRQLGRKCGILPKTVCRAIETLEAKGYLMIERRSSGRSNIYRIGQSVPQNGTVKHDAPVVKRAEKGNGGVPQRGTEACPKWEHNQTDQLNQSAEAAVPPTNNGFTLAPVVLESKAPTNGCSKFVALWLDRYRLRTGRDFPASGKGQLAGTLKNMLSDTGPDDLMQFIDRWFGASRKDYGIGLFKAKVAGADSELVTREGSDYNDPLALHMGRLVAQQAGGAR